MNVNLSTTKQRASYEILKRYRTNLYSNDYKLSEFCNKRLIFSQIMHFGSPVVTRNNGRIQESQNRFLKKFITRETASTTRNQNPSLFSLFILTRLKRGWSSFCRRSEHTSVMTDAGRFWRSFKFRELQWLVCCCCKMLGSTYFPSHSCNQPQWVRKRFGIKSRSISVHQFTINFFYTATTLFTQEQPKIYYLMFSKV